MTLTCLLNREGFIARKENCGCSQATSNVSDTSSNVDNIDFSTNEQMGSNSSRLVPIAHSEQSDPNDRGSDGLRVSDSQSCVQGTTSENLNCQESNAQVGDRMQHFPIESLDCQSSFSASVERVNNTEQNVDVLPIDYGANEITQQSLRIEDSQHSNNQEFSEVHIEHSGLCDINSNENNSSNHDIHMDGNVDDVNWNESSTLEVEQPEEAFENEGSDWYQNNIEWRNSAEENADGNQISNTGNEWPENTLGNADGENSHLQESHEAWQEDGGFQEAVENWLGGPSDHENAPVGRIRGFYFPEDDNVYSVELRELLNRCVLYSFWT